RRDDRARRQAAGRVAVDVVAAGAEAEAGRALPAADLGGGDGAVRARRRAPRRGGARRVGRRRPQRRRSPSRVGGGRAGGGGVDALAARVDGGAEPARLPRRLPPLTGARRCSGARATGARRGPVVPLDEEREAVEAPDPHELARLRPALAPRPPELAPHGHGAERVAAADDARALARQRLRPDLRAAA